MVNWHAEDNRIGHDIWNSVADEDTSEVEAFTRYREIPCTWNRVALKDAYENEHKGPNCRKGAYNPCCNSESMQWEDAAVHDQDGDLRDSQTEDIDDLVCEYSFANGDKRLEGHVGSLEAETMLNHYTRVSTTFIVPILMTHLSHSERNLRW